MKLTPKQKEIYQKLIEDKAISRNTATRGFDNDITNRMVRKGILKHYEDPIYGLHYWIRQENETPDNTIYHCIILYGSSYDSAKEYFTIVFLHYEDSKYNWHKILLPAIYRLANKLEIKRNGVRVEGVSLEHWGFTKYDKYDFNGNDFIKI